MFSVLTIMPRHNKHSGDMDHLEKWNQDETEYMLNSQQFWAWSTADKSSLLSRQILYADLIVKMLTENSEKLTISSEVAEPFKQKHVR